MGEATGPVRTATAQHRRKRDEGGRPSYAGGMTDTDGVQVADRDPETEPEPRPRAGRRLLVVTVVVVGLIVWVGGVVTSAGRAALDLREARSSLIDAERSLRQADLSGAREHLDEGVALATSASDRLHRFYVQPLRLVPVVSPNLRAATALSDAARDAGGAANDLLAAAATIVRDDRESVHGEISLSYLADLQAPMRRLAEALAHSTARVQDTGSDALLGPIATARETYLELAVPATEQAAIGADLLEVMPTFLGGAGPRRYLVGAGALSELRASGGLMGSWSIMTADGGHIDFDTFVDVNVLTSLEEDVAPISEEYAARYARLGSLRQWRNVNLTPDFPSSAATIVEMWDAQGLPPIDGVIMADPVTLARIAERSGGLEIPGVGVFRADEVLDFVALDAYVVFDDDDERKEVLGAVATSAFARVFDVLEDDDVPETVQMLSELASGGHLRIYSSDAEVQPALVAARVAAGLPDVDGEFAGVYVNNVAANKVDYFTSRRLEHRVRLRPDGVTRSVVSAEFTNDAPREGYPRTVLGPWTDHTEAGDNLSLVSVVCGLACQTGALPDGVTDGGTELGRPIVDVRLLLPAQTVRTVQVQTETADGWYVEDGDIVVPVTHHVQPTLRPSPLRVSIGVPEGWVSAAVPDGTEVIGDTLVWEGEASGVVTLEFRLTHHADAPEAARPGG